MKNRFFNNIIFKDVKEFNIIFLILISLFLVGISGYSSYAIFSDEIISNNEIKGIIKKQDTPGAETIVKKVGTDGLVKEEHPATSQLQATTDYRYTGKNPNNYIKFNGEVWRIIGVFDVDDGTGKLEKRIKIIRNEWITNKEWDSNRVNDWTKASAMTLLNSGDYWNRVGSYATDGLTGEAKSWIANAKWYLGGPASYQSVSNGLVSHFYTYERGTTVWSGRPTSWVGKVGLMYPSDYGYATSGGASTVRDECLAKEMYKWNDSLVYNCKDNDWLYDSGSTQWTITPYSSNSDGAFVVYSSGGYMDYNYVNNARTLRPTVYLKSTIQITGGDGSSSSPYELTLPPQPGADTIIDKEGSDGLVKETHPATEQLQATTDYRYTGKNPNNYIKFNGEVWRIIGVFDTDDGTGKLEKRMKIISDFLEGKIGWDSSGINDWPKASGMRLLNSGDYYNRTGSYISTGLTSEAKTFIGDAKWYLGGVVNHSSASNGLASHFYSYERGITVYKGHSTSWIGKVGLMYPSDYGYATSGGATTNRDACLAKEMINWDSSSFKDCRQNDWLYNSSKDQWTLTSADNSTSVFHVSSDGFVGVKYSETVTDVLRPTVFLRSDIQITGGTGTSSDPYTLSL